MNMVISEEECRSVPATQRSTQNNLEFHKNIKIGTNYALILRQTKVDVLSLIVKTALFLFHA